MLKYVTLINYVNVIIETDTELRSLEDRSELI